MAKKASSANTVKILSLEELNESINKTFGEGSFVRLGDRPIVGVPKVSSRSRSLDGALGGGFPEGRIIEIYGGESSGKTTMAIHVAIEVQKRGGRVAFIDAEHALDIEYCEQMGLNAEEMWLNQPDYGEQGLEILDKIVSSRSFNLVIVDSVAALTPKAEIEGEMGELKMGLHARLMSQAMRKVTAKIGQSNCMVIFINQTREKIGVMFGNPTTTTGGNALKFYASVRIETRRGEAIKVGEEQIGHQIVGKVVKNKVSPPFKKFSVPLIYGYGFSAIDEMIDDATQSGVLVKSGSWYSYEGSNIGQGMTQVRQFFEDNPEALEEVTLKTYPPAVAETKIID